MSLIFLLHNFANSQLRVKLLVQTITPSSMFTTDHSHTRRIRDDPANTTKSRLYTNYKVITSERRINFYHRPANAAARYVTGLMCELVCVRLLDMCGGTLWVGWVGGWAAARGQQRACTNTRSLSRILLDWLIVTLTLICCLMI